MTPGPERPGAAELPASEPACCPRCPRCLAPAALVVRYPHAWRNRSGERVDGLKEALLCPSCDTGAPTAVALLALLTGHGTGDGGAGGAEPVPAAAFGGLLQSWLDAVRDRAANPAALDAEGARWRAGEL